MTDLETLLAKKVRMERELILLRSSIAKAQREHSDAFRKSRLTGKTPIRVDYCVSCALRDDHIETTFGQRPTDHPDGPRLVAEKGREFFRRIENVGRATLIDLENWLEMKGEKFRF